jgi:hypothetical protein
LSVIVVEYGCYHTWLGLCTVSYAKGLYEQIERTILPSYAKCPGVIQ